MRARRARPRCVPLQSPISVNLNCVLVALGSEAARGSASDQRVGPLRIVA